MSVQDSNSDNDTGNDSDYDESMIQFGEVDFIKLNKRLLTLDSVCLCKQPADKISAIHLMKEMLAFDIQSDRHNCLVDNIIRCFNVISKETTSQDPDRLAFTDYFYRLRHEVLFKALMLAINLSPDKSDIPFSDFGINSNRTPDLITKVGKTLVIIEVGASSNFENTAKLKGSEDLGFESKYQKEIDILIDLSTPHCYLPFLFDMSDRSNKVYQDMLLKAGEYFRLNEHYKILLDVVYGSLCTLTSNFKDFMAMPSMLLFTTYIPVQKRHSDLEFLYRIEGSILSSSHYDEYYVSTPTYRKVQNNWHRIPNFLKRLAEKDTKIKKYIIMLEIKTGRLAFEEDQQNGATLDTLIDLHSKNDKPQLFKHTFLNMGERLVPAINSETGVLFKQKVTRDGSKKSNYDKDNYKDYSLTVNHTPSAHEGSIDLVRYIDLINKHYSEVYISNSYDDNYEETLLRGIKEYDDNSFIDINNNLLKNTDLNLLSDNKTALIDIDKVISDLTLKHVSMNIEDESIPLKVFKTKSPFIMPLADLCSTDNESLDFKNISLINNIISEIGVTNPFTTAVFEKIKEHSYTLYDIPKQKSVYLKELESDKRRVSHEITRMSKEVLQGKNSDERKQMTNRLVDYMSDSLKPIYNSLRDKISKIDKAIKKRQEDEGLKREIGLVRLPSKNKNTEMGARFNKEMSHFKDKSKQSTYTGVGIIKDFNYDHEMNGKIFDRIISEMPDHRGKNKDLLMDEHVSDDCKLLYDLKVKAISDYSSLINEVKDSMLGHASAFISRLGHSLLFYSQLPFNSDYIRVDNLGYKNCFLIVRGGKKIFKSKSSKLFRIFYPVSDTVAGLYMGDINRPCSTQVIKINNRKYLLTPWLLWHESILTDSLSFYTRVVSFTVLNLDNNDVYKKDFLKVSINVLLAFHNRRQTEVLLANMRYILLSTLGDFTGIVGVLPDFIGFNYDSFQSYIRSCILKNYPSYFKTITNMNKEKKSLVTSSLKAVTLKNIFTNYRILNPDDLTLMIYSTFLMTKAPYQKITERANNLKGILKIHEQYNEEVGLNISQQQQYDKLSITLGEGESFSSYTKRLFNCDFAFDPKYCANLGVFADSYYKNRNLKDRLHSEWIRIISKPWDSMATSTGLRGDLEDKRDFWGQKGYFVVYRNLSNRPDYVESIKNVLTGDELTDDERRKKIRTLNRMYVDELNLCDSTPEGGLVFHVVDKVQWRGSREIYVMDLKTKVRQQPIEQFMGELCKHLDNELISIPSDRRAQVIHHSIFEKDLPLKDLMTWYLTLDCTKWAPKSIFVKFAVMIINMDVIPPSFKTHFLNYLDSLYKKRIYFNKAEVEALLNNPVYREVCTKYLVEDKNVGGYYMLMPYSWVMGIFNYTSSFMHAINQMYASYLISKSALDNLGEDVSLTMFAHSDDSGGRLTCRNQAIAQRCIMLYEVNLKCSNHLISRKKSVISKIYFEILSIIYLFKKLLALLPKFLGGIRFLPTDKGPSQDLLQAYSKCNEVIVAGANFSLAYIVLKMVSALIWRFYFKRNPNKNDYKRPVQYLGMPDAHPLMVLISGSDSDIIRLLATGQESSLTSQMNLVNSLTETIDEPGPIRPFKYNIKVKNIGKNFDVELSAFAEILNDWTIKNVNFKSTPFNMVNFLSKLSDPGFLGSMTNESTVRRLSRCYYLRSNDSLILKNGLTSSESIISALEMVEKITSDQAELSDVVLLAHFKDPSIFWDSFNKNIPKVLSQINVMKNVLSGPLKICRYMESLSLENREYRQSERTLKPTHVQLYKAGKCFSVDFDPAQLVSYVKRSKFNWALPGVKRMETAKHELKSLCQTMDLDIDMLDENTLLKLCRNYQVKNVKDIYLYSQIPSDIRSIKTYSAFLSFIATNSFKGLEVGGLVLNLGGRINDPGYINMQIDDNIYTANTILTLILALAKDDINFVRGLTLSGVEEIGWLGGSVNDFLQHVINSRHLSQDYSLLKIQVRYLYTLLNQTNEGCSDIMEDSAYYVFTKEQRSKVGWRGVGELLIVLGECKICLSLYNDKINQVKINKIGKIGKDVTAFIFDILTQNGVRLDPNSLKSPSQCDTEFVFGYDYSGEISVCHKRECSASVNCIVGEINTAFFNDINFSRISHIKNELFVIETEIGALKKAYKLRCLRPKYSELALTAQRIFVDSDFVKKTDEMGLTSLEDFIYSELLINMGSEAQVKFEDFYDNFNSSKLYQIIKTVNEYDSSFVPSKIQTSQMPASKGGLFRIFLEYERLTNIPIIKTPQQITPEILSIRNEYPEQFSLILREKMEECYMTLFDVTERNEMQDAYMELLEIEDEGQLRSKIVNLMCYWGYDSLVNSLNLFSLRKSKDNYQIFRISGPDTKEAAIFSRIYEQLYDRLIKCMLKQSYHFNGLDYPISQIGLDSDALELKSSAFSVAYSTYMMDIKGMRIDILQAYFYNALLALLKDDDFCKDLTCSLEEVPAISTVKIDYENRDEFIATLNVLKYSWYLTNVTHVKHDLNTTVKLERLPPFVPQPVKLARKLDSSIVVTNNVYNHGYLTPDFYNEITKNVTFRIGEKQFRVVQKIAQLSDQKIKINRYFKIPAPLDDSVFEEDDWEDFDCELGTPDNELEDIEGFLEDTGLELKLKPSETKMTKGKGSFKTIDTIINWVIHPAGEGVKNNIERLNQTAENVIFISNSHYPEVHNLRNGFIKMVNLTAFSGKRQHIVLAHVICSKKLKKEFWDYFLPGEDFKPIGRMMPVLKMNMIRDESGVIKDSWSIGRNVIDSILFKKVDTGPEEVGSTSGEKEEEAEVDDYHRALEYIDMFENNNEITPETAAILREKYKKIQQDFIGIGNKPKKLDLLSLMQDMKVDNILKLVKNDIIFDLSKEQINKVMQSPEHFGLAHGLNKPSERHIKDRHVKAEINSLENSLMSEIASGSLCISRGMKSLCKSSFRLWNQSVKRTNYKKEQKEFLLTLFLTLTADSRLVPEDDNNDRWQRMVNNIQMKIAEEDEESDSDDDGHKFIPKLNPSSRLKYRAIDR